MCWMCSPYSEWLVLLLMPRFIMYDIFIFLPSSLHVCWHFQDWVGWRTWDEEVSRPHKGILEFVLDGMCAARSETPTHI